MECNTSFYDIVQHVILGVVHTRIRRTAAAMSTPKCVVCLAELPRSTSRRRLTSDSNKHIIPVLREIGHRVFSAVNELLPETNDTCLCRPCFRR